jgi:hypothetical protein
MTLGDALDMGLWAAARQMHVALASALLLLATLCLGSGARHLLKHAKNRRQAKLRQAEFEMRSNELKARLSGDNIIRMKGSI